jgi:23S rRNA pseudouridine1911/1915/1917 synthase
LTGVVLSASDLEILWEDESLLGLAKPAGIATQAPAGMDSLESRIRGYLATTSGKEAYLGLPHRLDRPVSGAMVFAKTRRAARQLSRQFQRRAVKKIYWAAVAGRVSQSHGTWIDNLWKVYGQPRTQVVDVTDARGQIAILHYQVIGTHCHGDWLEIELETGRTHQVRIQAASRGLPVVGDELYGSAIDFGTYIGPRQRPLALHARELSLTHPEMRAPLTLRAPLGPDWSALQMISFGARQT